MDQQTNDLIKNEIENLKIEILTLNRALESSEIETASKNLEIEILGERRPARVINESPCDPENKKLRA